MHPIFASTLGYISDHPDIALASVFLVALLESLALIGTLVPGAIALFAVGALVSAGVLDVWPTLALAVLGAAIGDGFSYELGRAGAGRIRAWRWMARYAGAMTSAEQFIGRHGGKSILLARFFGPLRASVPLVAGIAHMPRSRFYPFSIGAALLWAPAHIAPGMLFGASMQVAEAVTARLALLLLTVTALLWFVVWLVRIGIRLIVPVLRLLRDNILLWAGPRHSLPARVIRYFFDPRQAESEVILVLALLLFACGWIFLSILDEVVERESIIHADMAVFNFFQALRTAEVDRIMLGITTIGGAQVLMPVVALIIVWLLARRCWHSAAYWLAAGAFYEVFVKLLKHFVARQRPLNVYADRMVEQFSFPSGHATTGMVIYGFLAFLLCYRQPAAWRYSVTLITAILIALIGFSRIYLGAHWISDVIAGFCLGLAWITVLAMVYIHHRVREGVRPRWLAVFAVTSIAVFTAVHLRTNFSSDLARYTVEDKPQVVSLQEWSGGQWSVLPATRAGIGGEREEALALQWAGSAADIKRRLAHAGWAAASEWSPHTALLWLVPDPKPLELPVLPKFHSGQVSGLAFIHADPRQPQARYVIRLWQSRMSVRLPGKSDVAPVWYGTIYREELKRPWHIATIFVTTDSKLTPTDVLLKPEQIGWTIRKDASGQLVFLVMPG